MMPQPLLRQPRWLHLACCAVCTLCVHAFGRMVNVKTYRELLGN